MKIVSLLPEGAFDLVSHARNEDRLVFTRAEAPRVGGLEVYATTEQAVPDRHDPVGLWPYTEVYLAQQGVGYSKFPEPEEGTVYVVSQEVAIALRGTRPDVYVPGPRMHIYERLVPAYAGLVPTAG